MPDLIPRCRTCEADLHPAGESCPHFEEHVRSLGVHAPLVLARRLGYLEAKVDLLMQREKGRQSARKSRQKRQTETQRHD